MRRAALVVVAALVTAGAEVSAHDLHEGTARVTLRDDHLEVTADWDVLPLTGATPTELAVATDDALAEVHRRVRRVVEEETRLEVDGARVALEVTAFPSAPELRALAATASAAGGHHGEKVRLRLEVRRAVPGARHLTLTTPRAVGPVVASFVQPVTRYLRGGERAAFDVLGPALAPPPVPTPAPLDDDRSVRALGFAAVAATLTVLALRRSLRTSTPVTPP